MSKYDELKRLATLIVEVQTSQDVPISKLFDDFEAAACPETILALIAENERLEREAKNDLIAYKAVIERQNELRAENAGLKTGYQAYERVNAELKAESDTLRKDAERYRWLRNAKGLSLRSDGSKWTRSNGEQFICSHHLCAFDTSYAPFESLDEVIDTAMAQVDQS